MDARHSELLRTVPPGELGTRLRDARLAAGLTQADVAGEDFSVGYLSRIESGGRRPRASTLARLAERIGVGLDELLGGVPARELDELRLGLDFAELALETGDPISAETQARAGLQRAVAYAEQPLTARAHWLLGRALEGQGRLDEAVDEYELLIEGADLVAMKATIALCRVHREAGDFARAIDCAQVMLARLPELGLDGGDEAVQLAVTLAAAYFERGDVHEAARICRRAIAAAERLDSPLAKASAYWNAAAFQAEQGAVEAALPLTERAIALLGEAQDARNLARLRSCLGWLVLESGQPDIEEAHRILTRAGAELAATSASRVDTARNDLFLATANYRAGDHTQALHVATEVAREAAAEAPALAAEAQLLIGRILATWGQLADAHAAYRAAALTLTGIGADRAVAQLWHDLGTLLAAEGLMEEAVDAFVRSGAAAGLRHSPVQAVAPEPAKAALSSTSERR